jgi:DNA-binding NarL/FixJ family response regulator
LLVDDHALLREGTRAGLEGDPEIEVVAETGNGDHAVELARSLAPDVVLLDIRLEGMGGVDVARVLRQDLPAVKLLILSAYKSESYVRALFAIGVHGYLLKSATGQELVGAVHDVYGGMTVLGPEISAQLVGPANGSGIPATKALSDRERVVLELIGQGLTNKEIAGRLSIGTRTVESYVSNAMAKLGARSRAEAVTLALQRGIITSKE